MLELAFETLDLRTLCEDEVHASAKLGPDISAALKARLADIEACNTILDLPAGNPRFVNGAVHVSLGDGAELVLKANHAVELLDDTGQPDWNRIRRLRVLCIGRGATP